MDIASVASTTNTILTSADIYLVLMLPKLSMWFCILAVFLLIAAIVLIVYYNDEKENQKESRVWAKVWAWILVPFSVLLFTFGLAVPDRPQLIAMYVIPPIVNNVGVQKMPENLVKLINKEMEVALENLEQKQKDKDSKESKDKKAEVKPGDSNLDENLKKIATEAALAAAQKAIDTAKDSK